MFGASYTQTTCKQQSDRCTYYTYVKCRDHDAALHDGVRLAYVGQNRLDRYIRTLKDPLFKQKKNDVVYRINCKNCNASYVGQTGRQLQTRIKKHRRINQVNTNTVVNEHKLTNGHNFDWNGVQILNVERSWHKRIISEMIHIKNQTLSINAQSNTLLLDNIYLPIINKFKQSRSRKSRSVSFRSMSG